jgi:hypothetical protein
LTLSEDQFGGRDNAGDRDDVEYGEQAPQRSPPQRSPRRSPQGTPQKTAPPVRPTAPHPANTPLPTTTAPAGPSNPFKQGTKKFLIAQKLIAGEVDRSKMAREVGVSVFTIYNVASDLRQHGYTLSIDDKSPESYHPPPHHSPTHQESHPSEESVRLTDDTHQQSTSLSETRSDEKYFPGEVQEEQEVPPVRSRRLPPRPAQGITRDEVIEIVGEATRKVVESISPEVKPVDDMTGVNLPLEEVQLTGEKRRKRQRGRRLRTMSITWKVK